MFFSSDTTYGSCRRTRLWRSGQEIICSRGPETAPASFLYPVRETPITTGKVESDTRFQTV